MTMPLGTRKSEADKWMEKREVAALLYAARNVERDPRAYYLFAMMYLLGLRIGEALLLRWDHLGPLNSRGEPVLVMVPTLKQRDRAQKASTKTPAQREAWAEKNKLSVPVLGNPLLVLQAFDKKRRTKAERRKGSPWLFGGVSPAVHLSRTRTNRVFVLCREAARLRPGLSPHALRHSAVMALKSSGAGFHLCKRFLRHTEHGATETYLHVKPEEWATYRGALDLPPLRPLS